MHFSADKSGFFLACGDDDTIALYDIAARKFTKRFRGIPDPETFDLHPDGRHLYVSNEDDALVSVIDIETGTTVAVYETGEEPEGVLITPDGKLAFATSEAASLVHVMDTAKGEVIKDIIVSTRPRRMALTPHGKELWVSAELSEVVDIIDVASLTTLGNVAFLPKGMRREQVTPVDVLITKDGAIAYVALGRANHVAVVDVKSRTVLDYLLVGKRPWGLKLNKVKSLLYVANGLSDDVTIIETASNRSLVSVATGQVPCMASSSTMNRLAAILLALVLAATAAAAEVRTVKIAYVDRAGDPFYAHRESYGEILRATRQSPISGAELGAKDAKIIGRAIEVTFELLRETVPEGEAAAGFVRELVQRENPWAIILDLPASDVETVAISLGQDGGALFNIRHRSSDLRQKTCQTNLFHVIASDAMQFDSLTQYLKFVGWDEVLVLTSDSPTDLAEAHSSGRPRRNTV